MGKLLPKDIQNLKGRRKITKVTALDYFSARAIEKAGIDIIGLDGPPIEIYYKGAQNGIEAKMFELIFCLKAIRKVLRIIIKQNCQIWYNTKAILKL